MNTCETENEVKKSKSGQEVAKHNGGATAARVHVNYWKKRIFKPSYTRNGERREVPTFSARIQHAGRREVFPCNSSNTASAAETAMKIYIYLVTHGWEATLARYKRKSKKPIKVATVGELIEAAGRVSVANAKSVRQYGVKLRLIAAEIAKVKAGAERYGYQKDAFTKWRAKVDALSLSLLTGENVAQWRAKRIAAEKDPMRRQAAKVTADSTIRQAKALLGAKILPFIQKELTLPDPLPFTGVSLGKTTRRFRSDVSAMWLFTVARSELAEAKEEKAPERKDAIGRNLPAPKINAAEAKREQWKALCLLLMAGLRRAEADTLTWKQIDLEAGQLRIERTAYFSPKTADAERTIDLSPDAVEILRRFKAMPKPDPLFVLHGGKARPQSRREHYRADSAPWRTWEGLTGWLREKGVTTPKPLHTLRAMAGSLINESFGLEAARDFLGHADIKTTSASYMDKRQKVAVSFNLPETDFAAEAKEANR